jgi:hypothetical protein
MVYHGVRLAAVEVQMAGLLTFSEMALNFAVVIAGVFGLYLAWRGVKAARLHTEAALLQAKSARADIALNRFNRAAGQLSDAKLEVRLGAVYALGQVARESPDLAEPTFNLLSTYLRQTFGRRDGDKLPVDMREIMKLLDQLASKINQNGVAIQAAK